MTFKTLSSTWDIVVIGGGAAGFFAAIRCAELDPSLHVLILEKARQTLGKVLISGGGRCNVTHACFDPAKLITRYPRGGNELRGAFSRFQPKDTVGWFEERGVRLKTESDGRMFPVTDDSNTIANCLRDSARQAGVHVELGASVSSVEKTPQGGFSLEVRREAQAFHLQTKKLLFATGGDRKSLHIIQSLGHTIVDPVPSLFTFNIKDKRIDGLSGLSVADATLKMDSLTARGPLLITHWGMSGPAVLRLSAWGARILFEKNYASSLTVNWLGDYRLDSALEVLQRSKDWHENARRKVSSQPAFSQIPSRLWKQLAHFIGDKNWADVSKAELQKLARELTAGEYKIQGKGQFKEEFVTCGGVSLKEVDFKTMQSRIVDGLFFAGEVLDIDGLTGGFNFQAAWTTGWLAGNELGNR
ncbi:MAG: aminoacetone oxidase family FAD-binding enzyme [Chloroflexi bacterium]|nr:MAG: NAD(P)/FAD-dependent oxidoreductase [Chloroflexota bacterium]MCQ3937706.1 aminoacetone oxidase family FAD-binding enzyme [Chloroflexota bacterium]MDL1941082.1 NAD(P)/FAD-dependent oxidoreductase [Chloroflexi bacterium CFX2]